MRNPPSLTALRERRNEILSIANRRKAFNVRVFGSVAKGGSDEANDVDFLVTMAPGATLVDIIGLQHDLEDLLDCQVDVVSDDAMAPGIRNNVAATAVRL